MPSPGSSVAVYFQSSEIRLQRSWEASEVSRGPSSSVRPWQTRHHVRLYTLHAEPVAVLSKGRDSMSNRPRTEPVGDFTEPSPPRLLHSMSPGHPHYPSRSPLLEMTTVRRRSGERTVQRYSRRDARCESLHMVLHTSTRRLSTRAVTVQRHVNVRNAIF